VKNISDALYKLFVLQIVHEIQNSFIYKNISSHLLRIGLSNLGEYFKKASEEELEHRDKLIDYLVDRNIPIEIPNVEMLQVDMSSVLGIAQFTLDREEGTTAMIKSMVSQSNTDGDYLAYNFLLLFLEMQRQEEAESQTLLDNISGIDDDERLLRIFDQNFES
jgi:ferritin